MCQGIDYCLACQPTTEIEEWTQGKRHIMPVPGDNAQRETMTMRREIAFKRALRQGAAEAWPEYRDPSRSFDNVFTPEEQRYISGETNELPVLSRFPFAQNTRFRFIIGERVKNALRKFRKGDTAIALWREYQFACADLDPAAEAEVQRLFSLLGNLALARPATGLAMRKHLSRLRRYKNRLLRFLGRAVTKDFLVNAWRRHFALSGELSEQGLPESLAA